MPPFEPIKTKEQASIETCLHIAICDDCPADAAALAVMIQEICGFARISLFESGENFLQSYQKGSYHLIYLDIYMKGLTGMDVAAQMRNENDDTPIAFLTSSPDHALTASQYLALLYMEKPPRLQAVKHTLKMAAAILKDNKKNLISVIDSERNTVNIFIDDICYIDVLNHRCTIYLLQGSCIKVRTATTIDDLEGLLSAPKFCRCHRSYIVNFDHVKTIDGDFTMANGDVVYIRTKERRKIKNAYEAYLF